MLQNRLFSALASRSGFGAAIADAVACSSFASALQLSLCRLHCNGCVKVALCCVILLSFAARSRKSYWRGCIQAAIVICQQISEIFALLIFPFKNPFKKCFKIVFFLLWRRLPLRFDAMYQRLALMISIL